MKHYFTFRTSILAAIALFLVAGVQGMTLEQNAVSISAQSSTSEGASIPPQFRKTWTVGFKWKFTRPGSLFGKFTGTGSFLKNADGSIKLTIITPPLVPNQRFTLVPGGEATVIDMDVRVTLDENGNKLNFYKLDVGEPNFVLSIDVHTITGLSGFAEADVNDEIDYFRVTVNTTPTDTIIWTGTNGDEGDIIKTTKLANGDYLVCTQHITRGGTSARHCTQTGSGEPEFRTVCANLVVLYNNAAKVRDTIGARELLEIILLLECPVGEVYDELFLLENIPLHENVKKGPHSPPPPVPPEE